MCNLGSLMGKLEVFNFMNGLLKYGIEGGRICIQFTSEVICNIWKCLHVYIVINGLCNLGLYLVYCNLGL